MLVVEFFKLSTGQIALVGNVAPDLDMFIPACKADLYIDKQKIRTIQLIGEDRFLGVNEEKRQGKRSVRTEDDIIYELQTKGNKEARLIIFIDKR